MLFQINHVHEKKTLHLISLLLCHYVLYVNGHACVCVHFCVCGHVYPCDHAYVYDHVNDRENDYVLHDHENAIVFP